jgi:4-alpha-glucanotransferase
MTSPFEDRMFGVLLHPSSLAGPDDIGTFGREAYEFVDWLVRSGAGLWEVLPLTPNGRDDSPFCSYSAFAGNPWLVDVRLLHEAGLLPGTGLRPDAVDVRVPFSELAATKRPLLLVAAETFLSSPNHEWCDDFAQFRAREAWLADTAHFCALRDVHGGAPWWEWPEPVRSREPSAVRASYAELWERIEVWEALFYFADRQWSELRAYANSRGVKVLGELPIYVEHDSADVWLHQDEFQLDEAGALTAQSGVPPDGAGAASRLSGRPLYRWDVMAKDDYRWWVERLRRGTDLTDVVRIEHFRALSAYWEVPPGASDSGGGRWVPGPGQAFFDILTREFPGLPFVAEDLGALGEDVYRLRDDNKLLGMRIVQLGFDGTADNPHLPHMYPTSCIASTGTFESHTLIGWWDGLDASTREEVARYYQFSPTDDIGGIVWSFIEAVLGSRADIAVLPMQDLLVLGDRARMNDPSASSGNWSWRMPVGALSTELAGSLRSLGSRYGRLRG